VILVTDCIVCYRQAWSGMIQRSIASVVLASLCWLSVPVGFGSLEVPSAQGFRRDTANDHSCCPRSHPRISPILFLSINSTAMPCGEQHPCCVRQAPSNPSTMPVETKAIRLLRNECWPSSRMRLVPVAAALPGHRRSVPSRLPWNEAPSCASELPFFCLMHCTSRLRIFADRSAPFPGCKPSYKFFS
jgi:hypothetical protein